MAKDPSALSILQQRFVQEYLVDLRAGPAAARAGYSAASADQLGMMQMRNPKVRAEIDKALAVRERRTRITADRVLEELARIAFFDPRKLVNADGSAIPLQELDADTAAVIQSLEIEDLFEGRGDARHRIGVVRKYKIADKNTALTNAMKHLGMLSDRLVVQGDAERPVVVQQVRATLAETVAAIQLKKALG